MPIRPLLAVAAVALVWAEGAFGAYNPSLRLMAPNGALGGSGLVYVMFGQPGYERGDAATGRITVYAPRGYTVRLGHPAGTVLGGSSLFFAAEWVPLGESGAIGTLKAGNPADYVSESCAPGRHEAVWVMELRVAGRTFRFPIYVDRVTTGPEAAYASARMILCLPSPDGPPPQGAPGRVALLWPEFLVRGVFTNPRARGTYAWNAVFEAYAWGSAILDPTLTTQSTVYVRLPVQFTVRATPRSPSRRAPATLTACLREAGQPVRDGRVAVSGGATMRGAKVVGSGRTNARGCATIRIRAKRKVMFADGWAPSRQTSSCTPMLAPRCSEASVAPVIVVRRRVRF